MAEIQDTNDALAMLKRENAELSGMLLATGVILTQLLQRTCARELNPQQAAGRIMQTARDGIEGFSTATNADPVMKARALAAIDQYEQQIRDALAV
ncbi:MAG: hypothetical protein ACT4OU_10770 [Hyphomicrobium sp.]